MKKNLKFSFGVLLALAIFAAPSRVHARAVSNPSSSTPDAWCANGGGSYSGGNVTGAEICVDYNGNLLPTVGNVQTLGTSALPFLTVYSQSATNTGNETNGTAGTMTAAGTSGTAASQSIVNGLNVLAKVAITGIVASTTIPVNSSYETVMSTSGTTVSITALPSISTTSIILGGTELPSGTELVLTSTGASGVIFFDAGTLTGTQLQLGAATRTVTQFKVLRLIYDATDHFWREVSFANN